MLFFYSFMLDMSSRDLIRFCSHDLGPLTGPPGGLSLGNGHGMAPWTNGVYACHS